MVNSFQRCFLPFAKTNTMQACDPHWTEQVADFVFRIGPPCAVRSLYFFKTYEWKKIFTPVFHNQTISFWERNRWVPPIAVKSDWKSAHLVSTQVEKRHQFLQQAARKISLNWKATNQVLSFLGERKHISRNQLAHSKDAISLHKCVGTALRLTKCFVFVGCTIHTKNKWVVLRSNNAMACSPSCVKQATGCRIQHGHNIDTFIS